MPGRAIGEIFMQDDSIYFKVMSLLLQYPDEGFIEALPELKSVVNQLPYGRCKAGIEGFLENVENCSTLEMRERYTALFDMNPSTTLNVTYHIWGDGEKRARLLTDLQQTYSSAGFEKTTTELPDFLPLMLEFMAEVPEARRFETIQKSLKGIEKVVERLRKTDPPYSDLLAPLAGILREEIKDRTLRSIA